MNVALGGALWRDLADEVQTATKHDYRDYPREVRSHLVSVKKGSQLAQAIRVTTVKVNSLHHQACKKIAPGVRTVSTAPDGVVKGVEVHTHPFALGVQWHPEWIQNTPDQQGIFSALIAASHKAR